LRATEFSIARATEFSIARATEFSIARATEFSIARVTEFSIARATEFSIARVTQRLHLMTRMHGQIEHRTKQCHPHLSASSVLGNGVVASAVCAVLPPSVFGRNSQCELVRKVDF
jgi:hypothetical protein